MEQSLFRFNGQWSYHVAFGGLGEGSLKPSSLS